MLISLNTFAGMVPRVAARLLPNNAAQAAQNVKLASGNIRAWRTTLQVNTPTKPGIKTSIFRAKSGGADYWFHWVEQDVNTVLSPIANDSFKRIYWTGDGVPKMAPLSVAITGGTNYPVASYSLGLPAPTSVPTLTVGGVATSDDPSLVETRSYLFTFVDAYGAEGPPCDASLTVDVAPGQYVDLANLGGAPAGNYNIVTKRIYRTNSGSTTTEFQKVADIAVATDTYHDAIASADLLGVLPSTTWVMPPADLMGLIALPNGSLAGFSGNILCISEPYLPHAWPVAYQIVTADPIVGIGAYGNSILVATAGAPYIVTGSDPGAMTPTRLEEGYACVSKRGVVDMGYSVLYPSTLGLMMAGVNGVQLVTKDILGIDEWQALNPSTLRAYHYAGHYFGFTDTCTFIFNPSSGDFSKLDAVATAGFHDPATGELFLMVGNDIVKWDAGAGIIPLAWKSKQFVVPYPLNLGAAQVLAEDYPVTVKVYAKGNLKLTRSVTDSKPFRLPSGFREVVWEVEVSGENTVNQILLASTISELIQA